MDSGLAPRGAPRNDGESVTRAFSFSPWEKEDSRRLRQSSRFDRGDLQRDVAAVDSGLRECTADEPEAGLRRAGPHVAEFGRSLVKTPDAADALCDLFAEQLREQMIGTLVAGGEHEEVGLARGAVAQAEAVGDIGFDIAGLDQLDLAVGDQLGSANVEIIAAAAGAEFQWPAGAVLAIFEPEACGFQPRQRGASIRFTSSVTSLCASFITGSGTPELRMSLTAMGGPSPR